MQRLAIAARIYCALIERSTRDLSAVADNATQQPAIEALAAAALRLADVLIDTDAKSRPNAPSLATR